MRDLVNFSAGPSVLPGEVLESLSDNMRDYSDSGLSLVEVSHRGDVYGEVHESCISLLRELMDLPDSHEVILLGGGATLQFSMVPMNLLDGSGSGGAGGLEGRVAAYVNSGAWAGKAIAEARKQGSVRVVYDGSEEGFSRLPSLGELEMEGREAYLHITTNETIGGLQWPDGFWEDMGAVPLVADASSDVLSRPMDFGRFGIVYAGAQKNLGPAGVTVIVIRKDLLERSPEHIGSYLSYKVHAAHNSLYNTPPVFSIWGMKLVLESLKERGGVEKVKDRNEAQARAIYDEIKDSEGFYFCRVQEGFRSRMNVVWNLGRWTRDSVWEVDKDLEGLFLADAAAAGLVGLKGHRSVGGVRASIYNAMTDSGVERLVSFMRNFRRKR